MQSRNYQPRINAGRCSARLSSSRQCAAGGCQSKRSARCTTSRPTSLLPGNGRWTVTACRGCAARVTRSIATPTTAGGGDAEHLRRGDGLGFHRYHWPDAARGRCHDYPPLALANRMDIIGRGMRNRRSIEEACSDRLPNTKNIQRRSQPREASAILNLPQSATSRRRQPVRDEK